MKYTVYLRTNTVNGMQYVGQTSNISARNRHFKSLKSRYSCEILDSDRRKYGVDNFELEILAEVETQEEAWELEQTFIKAYNTIYPNGYNVSSGGNGANGVSPWHKGKHLSEETRKKISEVRKAEGNGMYGKTPWNKGKKYKGKTLRSIIYEYDFDGNLIKEWERLSDIEDVLGISHTGVSQCANGKIPSYKSRFWSYSQLTKGDIINLNRKRIEGKSHRGRKVNQYNSKGELLATYDTLTIASEKIGVTVQTILNILKGRSTSPRENMIFKYA